MDIFNVTISGQNWTSHLKFRCLNLDNVYAYSETWVTSPTTKNNSAFFISSQNLRKDSFVYTLATSFSSMTSLVERTGEELFESNSAFASFCRILIIILSNYCTNSYNRKQIFKNLFKYAFILTFVCFSYFQRNFYVNTPQPIFCVSHRSL